MLDLAQLNASLDRAWELKQAQKRDAFATLWAEVLLLVDFRPDEEPTQSLRQLGAQLGWPLAVKFAAQLALELYGSSREDFAKQWLSCLEASVIMAVGNDYESLYFFHTIKGLLRFEAGDFAGASLCFTKAKGATVLGVRQASALTLELAAKELLGVDAQASYAQLKQLTQQINLAEVPDVPQFLRGYEMRALMNAGRFHAALEQTDADEPGQHDLICKIINLQLPYVGVSNPYTREQIMDVIAGIGHRNTQAFVQATVLGEAAHSPTDWYIPEQMVDRIYIWLWRYLKEPRPGLAHQLLANIVQLNLRDDPVKLSAEGRLRLRNVFLWLAALDPEKTALIRTYLNLIALPPVGFAPLFDYEGLLAEAMIERRLGHSASVFVEARQGHPLEASGELDLMRQIVAGAWAGAGAVSGAGAGIVVDTRAGDVYRHGERTFAPALAHAFALLTVGDRQDIEYFAKHCLGIAAYRDESHRRRVFGLLREMKDLLGAASVIRVQGRTIVRSEPWPVHIRSGASGYSLFSAEPLWAVLVAKLEEATSQGFSEKQAVSPKNARILKAIGQGLRYPREIMAATGMPKSTLHRHIEELRAAGLVEVQEGVSPQLSARTRRRAFHLPRDSARTR